MTPLDHLNEIFEGHVEALMLMTPFSVQVLFPKLKNSQIHKMMTTLKETSKRISNNEKLSAEKSISL
jgi:hypothetical protein